MGCGKYTVAGSLASSRARGPDGNLTAVCLSIYDLHNCLDRDQLRLQTCNDYSMPRLFMPSIAYTCTTFRYFCSGICVKITGLPETIITMSSEIYCRPTYVSTETVPIGITPFAARSKYRQAFRMSSNGANG